MDPSYNNSFDSFGSNSGQFGGDIVIDAKTQRSKKKTILVIGVICLIVVASLVAILLFLPKEKGKRQIFNEYANYLLYGTESSKDIVDDYDWGYRYYADDLDVIIREDYKQYLDSLKTKYEAFSNVYEIDNDYNDVFWLFWYAHMYPDPGESIVDRGDDVELSQEEISKIVKEYYEPLLNSQHELVQKYGNREMKKILGERNTEYVSFPDYDLKVFSKIWEMKGEIYEENN